MCVNARKFEYLRIIYELGKISSAVNVVLDSGLKISGDTAKPADKSSTKCYRFMKISSSVSVACD